MELSGIASADVSTIHTVFVFRDANAFDDDVTIAAGRVPYPGMAKEEPLKAARINYICIQYTSRSLFDTISSFRFKQTKLYFTSIIIYHKPYCNSRRVMFFIYLFLNLIGKKTATVYNICLALGDTFF